MNQQQPAKGQGNQEPMGGSGGRLPGSPSLREGSDHSESGGTGHRAESMSPGAMGMTIFLITLAVLFLASMIGYLIVAIRLRSPRTVYDPQAGTSVPTTVEPVDLPNLPAVLILSTIVILISSGTIQWAKSSIRKGSEAGLRAGMTVTLVLGLAFLALQTIAWIEWYDAAVVPLTEQFSRFAALAFLILSGLHAAHVLGGLIPMAVVTIRSYFGRYTPARHEGVSHITAYWHFLDAVWLVMYASLLIFTR